MPVNCFIVIVGCGRLGSYLANKLSKGGDSVVVIDSDERAFNNLSVEFSGFRVEGDATEMAVLKQAKTEKANVVMLTTENDNVNLMAAQMAKKIFGVKRVMARVYAPQLEEVFRPLGIETICPTTLVADMFLESLSRAPEEFSE